MSWDSLGEEVLEEFAGRAQAFGGLTHRELDGFRFFDPYQSLEALKKWRSDNSEVMRDQKHKARAVELTREFVRRQLSEPESAERFRAERRRLQSNWRNKMSPERKAEINAKRRRDRATKRSEVAR